MKKKFGSFVLVLVLSVACYSVYLRNKNSLFYQEPQALESLLKSKITENNDIIATLSLLEKNGAICENALEKQDLLAQQAAKKFTQYYVCSYSTGLNTEIKIMLRNESSEWEIKVRKSLTSL